MTYDHRHHHIQASVASEVKASAPRGSTYQEHNVHINASARTDPSSPCPPVFPRPVRVVIIILCAPVEGEG